MINLHRLHAAHVEWLGIRSALSGIKKREFVRWLCETYPKLVPKDMPGLTLLRQQCREIQRGSSPPPQRGRLSMTTLKQYANELTVRYLAEPNPRPTFADFLERVLAECPTEDALQRFLGPPSASPSS